MQQQLLAIQATVAIIYTSIIIEKIMVINKLQKADELLAQCPCCHSVKFIFSKKEHWQKSICEIPHLKPVLCYICKQDEQCVADTLDLIKQHAAPPVPEFVAANCTNCKREFRIKLSKTAGEATVADAKKRAGLYALPANHKCQTI